MKWEEKERNGEKDRKQKDKDLHEFTNGYKSRINVRIRTKEHAHMGMKDT